MTSSRDWPLVAAGTSLVAVCYGFARFAYGLTAPDIGADLDLTGAVSGLIAAGSYVGYCLAIVASIVATPRWGARRTATVAGLVAVVGTATVALAPTAGVLAVGVLVAGASTGAASPPLAAAVARWVAAPHRDRSQTVVNAGVGLGVVLSGPVALAVGPQWRLAWACFAVAALAATAWIWRVIPPAEDPDPAEGADGGAAATGGARVLPPVVAGSGRLVVVAVTLGAVSVATWTFGRDLVQSTGGMSSESSAWLWVVLGAAGALGALGGDLAARVGATRLWRVLLLALSGATAALAAWPSGAAAYVSAAVFGAAYVALTGLVLVAASRVWPDHVGPGVGVGFLAIAAGQAVAAPVLGALGGQVGLACAFWAAAALGALASLVTLPDGRRPDGQTQDAAGVGDADLSRSR